MTEESKERDYRCVKCGFRIKTLYIQYSPGNIRLMKCQSCNAVADEYIECEFMILFIDLILHKAKAYRHLFYNMFSRESLSFEASLTKQLFGNAGASIYFIEGLLRGLSFGFLLLDAYRLFILIRNEGGWRSSSNSGSLIWSFGKIWMDVLFGNFLLFCILLLGTRIFMNASVVISSYKDILLAVLVSSYFKIFLIAMMVWEFPSSVIFIIDMFVLSSNIVAIKVITDSTMIRCLAICFCAHALKFVVCLVFNIHYQKLIV